MKGWDTPEIIQLIQLVSWWGGNPEKENNTTQYAVRYTRIRWQLVVSVGPSGRVSQNPIFGSL